MHPLRHLAQQIDGSGRITDTNGLQSYDAVFADTRLWVQKEWIDYIAPQIYWYFDYGPAAYEKLIDWWTQQTKGKKVKLYIGHAAYRVGDPDPNWQDPRPIADQILFNRSYEGVDGSIFFATNNLLGNPLGIKDRLQNDLFRYPALVPHLDWLDVPTPDAPESLRAYSLSAGEVQLVWEDASNETAYYVIYRTEGDGGTPDTNDAKQIVATVPKSKGASQQTYIDVSADPSKTYSYVVTAVNRVLGESAPSGSVSPVEPGPPIWEKGVLQADDVTATGLTLKWSGARDDLGIAEYRIYQDGKLLLTVSGGTEQYQVTGLSPETDYEFKVEAGNEAGKWSVDGPSVKVKTPAVAPPSWKNGVLQADNVTATGLTLTWSGVTDELGIAEYRIYQDGQLLTTVSGDTERYRVTGLSPETDYEFKVEAGDEAGKWSVDGPSVKVKTRPAGGGSPTPPSPPATPPGDGGAQPPDEDAGETPDSADEDEETPSDRDGAPADEEPAAFTDTFGHWAQASIRRAVERKIINGYPDQTFRPDRPSRGRNSS